MFLMNLNSLSYRKFALLVSAVVFSVVVGLFLGYNITIPNFIEFQKAREQVLTHPPELSHEQSTGAEYFVVPTSNNTNSGAIGSLLHTLPKAASAMTSGDILFIHGGSYQRRL